MREGSLLRFGLAIGQDIFICKQTISMEGGIARLGACQDGRSICKQIVSMGRKVCKIGCIICKKCWFTVETKFSSNFSK